ncbi:MAG: molybdopterin-binding protein [Planctomycetota bacterium]|jgi:molybdopterin biosynthesis enzyme MoaB
MIRSAILTISDRCSEGKQEDLSGLEIEKILKENNFEVCTKRIVPDEVDRIIADLIYFSDEAETWPS